MPANNPLIPGVDVDFGGGRIMTIPPLSLGALKRLQTKLAALNEMSALDPRAIEVVVDAAHSALVRNYPDMTLDQVEDLIDVSQLSDVMTAVLDVSGLQRKAQADEKNQTAQPAPQTLTGQP
jgi:hypothetical protein